MLTKSTRVALQSKLTAVSSKPIGSGKTHPFSALDCAMSLHSLHLIFYYPTNPFGSFDLHPLRASLSEALSLYPAVTGRLIRGNFGNWEVNCNDAGIRVIRAKVGVTLDQWLSSADGSEETDLAVWDDMPQDPSLWSPFRIQLNEFEGGGVAIGLSCSHMHADPTCATLFYKSWTQYHLHEPIDHPPFFHPLPLHPLPHNSESTHYYSNKSTNAYNVTTPSPSLKMSTSTFKFSSSMIKQCLLQVKEKCPNATPFDFLTGLFWTCIANLKPPTHGHGHTHSLSICVDFRKLLDPPLPYGYFGNALQFSLLSLDEQHMVPDKLGDVVGLVHHRVSGFEQQECQTVIDWFDSQKDETGKFALPFRMYGPELTCVSMEHMILPGESASSLIYAATFEKNTKPLHVSCQVGNVDGEGLIIVMPSPEEGLARTVMVTLPEDEMAKLCKDDAIMSLKPTMLVSGTPLSSFSLDKE